ncbi:hypothetical protein ACFQX8_15155 [Klenkia terrae]
MHRRTLSRPALARAVAATGAGLLVLTACGGGLGSADGEGRTAAR